MTHVSLVVMEKGSDWPGQVAGVNDVVAFSQDDAALLRRTQEKLEALRSAATVVRLAVLACNGTYGGAVAIRRTGVARALLGAVSGASFGRLVLTASAFAQASLRAELLTLAGELTRGLGQSSASISLQFTATPGPLVASPSRRPLAAMGMRS
jgi:hypothetical protein